MAISELEGMSCRDCGSTARPTRLDVAENAGMTLWHLACPDCGEQLVMAEGCVSCKSCGYSRCL